MKFLVMMLSWSLIFSAPAYGLKLVANPAGAINLLDEATGRRLPLEKSELIFVGRLVAGETLVRSPPSLDVGALNARLLLEFGNVFVRTENGFARLEDTRTPADPFALSAEQRRFFNLCAAMSGATVEQLAEWMGWRMKSYKAKMRRFVNDINYVTWVSAGRHPLRINVNRGVYFVDPEPVALRPDPMTCITPFGAVTASGALRRVLSATRMAYAEGVVSYDEAQVLKIGMGHRQIWEALASLNRSGERPVVRILRFKSQGYIEMFEWRGGTFTRVSGAAKAFTACGSLL